MAQRLRPPDSSCRNAAKPQTKILSPLRGLEEGGWVYTGKNPGAKNGNSDNMVCKSSDGGTSEAVFPYPV